MEARIQALRSAVQLLHATGSHHPSPISALLASTLHGLQCTAPRLDRQWQWTFQQCSTNIRFASGEALLDSTEDDDQRDLQVGNPSIEDSKPKDHIFVSQNQRRSQRLIDQIKTMTGEQQPSRQPDQKRRIYFPNIQLQMMKLSQQQMDEIKQHGWTREVAFKTTPNVTKLEIKAFLEAVYGMTVERVSTINYLGKKRFVRPIKPGRQRWDDMREDDWKKAYVIFGNPPASYQPPTPPKHASPTEMLETLRNLRLNPDARRAVLADVTRERRRGHKAMIDTRTFELINPHTALRDEDLEKAYAVHAKRLEEEDAELEKEQAAAREQELREQSKS